VKSIALWFVIVLAAGGIAAAAPNGGWDVAWSPDGTRLAYTSGTRHGIPNLWVQPVAGGAPRRLTVAGAHTPCWIPGTHTLVFGTLRTGKPQYMSIAADGAEGSEQPYALPGEAVNPTWSPDGTLVAYGLPSEDGRECALYYARTAGGPAVRLTTNFWVREWAWTPDGASLLFIVGRSAGASLWRVDLAKRDDIHLVFRNYCTAPAVSPNGKYVVVGVPDVRTAFHPQVIELTTRKALPETQVRSCNGKRFLWSPDSTRLFFCSSRKSEAAVWGVNLDGTDLKRVTPTGTPAAQPALSPDGTRIAFQATPVAAFGPEINTIATDGSGLKQWTTTTVSAWSPSWAPSGKYLLYQTDMSHADELVISAVGVWKSRPLVGLVSGDPAELSWFPDGKRLIVADGGRLAICEPLATKNGLRPMAIQHGLARSPRVTGNEIVFTDWSVADPAVAVMRTDGGAKRFLTHGPATPAGPPAPPSAPKKTTDARTLLASLEWVKIADAAPAADPHSGLGIMAPVPSITTAAAAKVVDSTPVRSPDGTRVAFVRQSQVWVVGYDGRLATQLTHLPLPAGRERNILAPVWAKDGKALYFLAISTADGPLELQLWASSLTPDSATCVYREAVSSEFGIYYAFCTNAPVLLDAGHLLFTSLAGGVPRVAKIALDGTGYTPLTAGPSAFPALDTAGGRVAFIDLADEKERLRILFLANGAESAPVN
jgi:Tol biopolymer transport system component